MGRNGARDTGIVRNGQRATAVSERSREYCSVLETINTTGRVLPPFTIWQGKTHRASYFQPNLKDAIFAVSPSGYMDDERRLWFTPFEPRRRSADRDSSANRPHPESTNRPHPESTNRPWSRVLVVDEYSSHIAWPVVDYHATTISTLYAYPPKVRIFCNPLMLHPLVFCSDFLCFLNTH